MRKSVKSNCCTTTSLTSDVDFVKLCLDDIQSLFFQELFDIYKRKTVYKSMIKLEDKNKSDFRCVRSKAVLFNRVSLYRESIFCKVRSFKYSLEEIYQRAPGCYPILYLSKDDHFIVFFQKLGRLYYNMDFSQYTAHQIHDSIIDCIKLLLSHGLEVTDQHVDNFVFTVVRGSNGKPALKTYFIDFDGCKIVSKKDPSYLINIFKKLEESALSRKKYRKKNIFKRLCTRYLIKHEPSIQTYIQQQIVQKLRTERNLKQILYTTGTKRKLVDVFPNTNEIESPVKKRKID